MKRKKQPRLFNQVELADILSLSQRDRFILNVKYKNDKYSLDEWKSILIKEGFVLKNG